MSQGEKNIGTLIVPERYLHELNQVAAVTSTSIVFLKRKFVSSSGWELVKYPVSDCFEVRYEQELPIARMALGGRQHRLKFKMHDGSMLTWKSRAGERQLKSDQVNAIVEFARSKGLLSS